MSASQIALAGCCIATRVLLIAGTSSVAHLAENLAAADVRLDDADIAELEHVRQAGDPLAAAHD